MTINSIRITTVCRQSCWFVQNLSRASGRCIPVGLYILLGTSLDAVQLVLKLSGKFCRDSIQSGLVGVRVTCFRNCSLEILRSDVEVGQLRELLNTITNLSLLGVGLYTQLTFQRNRLIGLPLFCSLCASS